METLLIFIDERTEGQAGKQPSKLPSPTARTYELQAAILYLGLYIAQHGQPAQPFSCKSPHIPKLCECFSWNLQQTLHSLGYLYNICMYCTYVRFRCAQCNTSHPIGLDA